MSFGFSADAAVKGHPPCGGCGLKSCTKRYDWTRHGSPSVWRVWIEITVFALLPLLLIVTLRVEGVD